MLNTTRLLRRMLAVRYSALMFCGPFHLAFFASVYHALKAFSASGCFSQNDFSVLTEITRMIQNTVFPNWEQARRVHGGLACPPLSFWRREMEMIGPEFSFDLLARALANRLHYLDPGAGHTRMSLFKSLFLLLFCSVGRENAPGLFSLDDSFGNHIG
jgi:hypothetical protein